MVDAGNAIWLGLVMYVVAAIFMFFFALQLLHAVRTDDERIRPRRVGVIGDLDKPESDTAMMKRAMMGGGESGDWKRRTTSYRVPGKTHGDWLQDPAERQRRRKLVT